MPKDTEDKKAYEPRTRWNVEHDRMEESSRKNGKTTWTLLDWPTPKEELTQEEFSKVFLRLRRIQHKTKRIDETERKAYEVTGVQSAKHPVKTQDKFSDTEDNIVYKRKAPKKDWINKNEKNEPIPHFIYYHRTIKTPRTLLYETYFKKELWEFGEEPVKNMLQTYKKHLQSIGVWETMGWKEVKPPIKSNKKKTYNMEELGELLLKEKQDTTDGFE